MAAFVQICEWQLMQISVAGMPAKIDVTTDVLAMGNRCRHTPA